MALVNGVSSGPSCKTEFCWLFCHHRIYPCWHVHIPQPLYSFLCCLPGLKHLHFTQTGPSISLGFQYHPSSEFASSPRVLARAGVKSSVLRNFPQVNEFLLIHSFIPSPLIKYPQNTVVVQASQFLWLLLVYSLFLLLSDPAYLQLVISLDHRR